MMPLGSRQHYSRLCWRSLNSCSVNRALRLNTADVAHKARHLPSVLRSSPAVWDQREEWALDDEIVVHHTREGQHGEAAVVQLAELQVVLLLLRAAVAWPNALHEARAEVEVTRSTVLCRAIEHVQHGDLAAVRGALDVASEAEEQGAQVGGTA